MMTMTNNYQRILFLVWAKLIFSGTRLKDVLLHIFWSKEEHIIWTYLIPIIKPLKKKIDYMFLELNFYISNYVLLGSFVKNRDNSISVRVGLPKHKLFILVAQIIQVCSLILTLCFYYLLVDDFQKNSEIILFLIVFSNMVTFLNCFIDLLRIEKRKMVYYTFSGYHNPSATQREHKQTLRKNFLYHSCRMLLKNDFLCKQITILFTAIFSFFLFIVISLFEISIIDILHELEKSNLYFLSLIFFISILMFWYTRRHKRFIVKKRNSKSYYLTKSVYTFTDGLRLSWISLIALVCLFDPKLVYETRDSIVNFFISYTSDSFFSINLLGVFLIGSGFIKCLELPLVDSACEEGDADDSIPSIFRKLNPDKCFKDYAHDEDVVRPFIDSKKYSQNVYNLKTRVKSQERLTDMSFAQAWKAYNTASSDQKNVFEQCLKESTTEKISKEKLNSFITYRRKLEPMDFIEDFKQAAKKEKLDLEKKTDQCKSRTDLYLNLFHVKNLENTKALAASNKDLLDSLNRKLEVELIKESTALSYNKNVLGGNKVRQEALKYHTKTFADCIRENSTGSKPVRSCHFEADLSADHKAKLGRANLVATKKIQGELPPEEEVYFLNFFREQSERTQKNLEKNFEHCIKERTVALNEQRDYCESKSYNHTYHKHIMDLMSSEERAAADKKLLDFLREDDDTHGEIFNANSVGPLDVKINSTYLFPFILITVLISLFFKLVVAFIHFWTENLIRKLLANLRVCFTNVQNQALAVFYLCIYPNLLLFLLYTIIIYYTG